MTKRRISASIDPDLLSAAEAAVKRRGSSNFSAWMAEHVNMPTGLRHIQRIS
jgi:hypothetical protein